MECMGRIKGAPAMWFHKLKSGPVADATHLPGSDQ